MSKDFYSEHLNGTVTIELIEDVYYFWFDEGIFYDFDRANWPGKKQTLLDKLWFTSDMADYLTLNQMP